MSAMNGCKKVIQVLCNKKVYMSLYKKGSSRVDMVCIYCSKVDKITQKKIGVTPRCPLSDSGWKDVTSVEKSVPQH